LTKNSGENWRSVTVRHLSITERHLEDQQN